MIIHGSKVYQPSSNLEQILEELFRSVEEHLYHGFTGNSVKVSFTAEIPLNQHLTENKKETLKIIFQRHGFELKTVQQRDKTLIICFE